MPFQPMDQGRLMALGEQIKNARYARDPNNPQNRLLQLKIQAAQQAIDNPQSAATYAKQPFFVRQGNTVSAYQLSDQGGARKVDLPPNAVPAIRGTWKDLGGGVQFLDNYGRNPSALLGAAGISAEIPDTSAPLKGNLGGANTGFIEKTLPPAKQPKNIRAAEEAKRAVELQTTPAITREKETAQGQAKRAQDWINRGTAAAEAYPVLGRALQLLEGGVETGGIDNLRLMASNFFGVTGADEAELSNNLGKAVLKQLRETFGAAFTVEEGKRLERIEANYGKSTAGNIRLLKQAQKLTNEIMQRGLKAAQGTKDDAAIDAIQRGYVFSLDVPEEGGLSPEEQRELDELEALEKAGKL